MRRCSWAAAAVAVAALLALPASASAALPSVLGGQTVSGSADPLRGPVGWRPRLSRRLQRRWRRRTLRLKSFDGTPLEVYVILPPAPASGTDGPYPLVVQSHGWGSKAERARATPSTSARPPTHWAAHGYAVLQLTARGFGDSCGKAASRIGRPFRLRQRLHPPRRRPLRGRTTSSKRPGCWSTRASSIPQRIGVTGESYGGGVSLELATLKDRVMNADGSLHPWTSPPGTPLSSPPPPR